MQNKNNNLKKNIYYIIDIYIYIYVCVCVESWAQIIQLGFGLWLRAWGFGQEREKYESEEEYLLG